MSCAGVTLSIDGGDNYYHPCGAIAETYAGSGHFGAAVTLSEALLCASPPPQDVGVLYPEAMGFLNSGTGAYVDVSH